MASEGTLEGRDERCISVLLCEVAGQEGMELDDVLYQEGVRNKMEGVRIPRDRLVRLK